MPMPATAPSLRHLLSLWPSLMALAADLGLPYTTVHSWLQRGSIPVLYWHGLIESAQARGIAGGDEAKIASILGAPKCPNRCLTSATMPSPSSRSNGSASRRPSTAALLFAAT